MNKYVIVIMFLLSSLLFAQHSKHGEKTLTIKTKKVFYKEHQLFYFKLKGKKKWQDVYTFQQQLTLEQLQNLSSKDLDLLATQTIVFKEILSLDYNNMLDSSKLAKRYGTSDFGYTFHPEKISLLYKKRNKLINDIEDKKFLFNELIEKTYRQHMLSKTSNELFEHSSKELNSIQWAIKFYITNFIKKEQKGILKNYISNSEKDILSGISILSENSYLEYVLGCENCSCSELDKSTVPTIEDYKKRLSEEDLSEFKKLEIILESQKQRRRNIVSVKNQIQSDIENILSDSVNYNELLMMMSKEERQKVKKLNEAIEQADKLIAEANLGIDDENKIAEPLIAEFNKIIGERNEALKTYNEAYKKNIDYIDKRASNSFENAFENDQNFYSPNDKEYDGVSFPNSIPSKNLKTKIKRGVRLFYDENQKQYKEAYWFILDNIDLISKLYFNDQLLLLVSLFDEKDRIQSNYKDYLKKLDELNEKYTEEMQSSESGVTTTASLEYDSHKHDLIKKAYLEYMANKTGNPNWLLSADKVQELALQNVIALTPVDKNIDKSTEDELYINKDLDYTPTNEEEKEVKAPSEYEIIEAELNTNLYVLSKHGNIESNYSRLKNEIHAYIGEQRTKELEDAIKAANDMEVQKNKLYEEDSQTSEKYLREYNKLIRENINDHISYSASENKYRYTNSSKEMNPFFILYYSLNYPKEWKQFSETLENRIRTTLMNNKCFQKHINDELINEINEEINVFIEEMFQGYLDSLKLVIQDSEIEKENKREVLELINRLSKENIGVVYQTFDDSPLFDSGLAYYMHKENSILVRPELALDNYIYIYSSLVHEVFHAVQDIIFIEQIDNEVLPKWMKQMAQLFLYSSKELALNDNLLYLKHPIEHVPNELGGLVKEINDEMCSGKK